MLRKFNDSRGLGISAIDGTIGRLEDFYFDDRAWVIRHLVVDAGTWSSIRKVRLTRVLNELLEPMRQRRAQYEGNMARVRDALEHGTDRARALARKTMEKVHDALDLDYLRKYR